MSTSLQPPYEPLPQAPDAPPGGHVLDNAVWAALTGPHRHLAEVAGGAARYRADVSPFAAVADPDDPRCWADLAGLIGPGNPVAITPAPRPPAGWTGRSLPGVQMTAVSLAGERDPEAVRLGPADVPEMLALVERTRPGPFLTATIDMGGYYGIRRDGRLVAMAGERMRTPGWTEISAVCTDEAHRGQGLANRLMRQVAADILDRGELPFLHAAAVNTGAIALYASMGFTTRRPTPFHFLEAPRDTVGGRGPARPAEEAREPNAG